MAFRINGSLILAVLLAAGLGAWMYAGDIVIGGESDNGTAAVPIAEREAEKSADLFKVRYVEVKSEERTRSITIRGRTQADAIVSIRAETNGVLQERLVSKGDSVKPGDLVCVLDKGTRESNVTQAKAQLVQATTEYEANLTLQKKGFAAKNRLNQLKAAVDSAKAALAAAEQELSRIEIRSNASGIVQDPVAEVGDMLSAGGNCVTLIDTDPMLFIGQVAELEINRIEPGMPAEVTLVTGDKVTGKVKYIASASDPQTRTYETEIELEKSDNIRDGMTAQAEIALKGIPAIRISPSWITLSDTGVIGVRTVDKSSIVAFVPVNIVAQDKDGFWISGLEDEARVITLGQEYVTAGEKVEAIPDTRAADGAVQTSSVTN